MNITKPADGSEVQSEADAPEGKDAGIAVISETEETAEPAKEESNEETSRKETEENPAAKETPMPEDGTSSKEGDDEARQ